MADPFTGRTIDQYEVLDTLGGGGMGIVYRARDTKLGRHVALKFLPPQWAHDDEAKQRFIREAQAASATDHRNICTIHDVGKTEEGFLFIVMALYEGPTLKRRLQDGPLGLDDALDIATQVAEGLAKAHVAGVVHRDVKPGNLILTDDAVKIVDFGLATFSAALQLTIEGTTLGTAAYMSPEQSRGEEVGPATDVWAVGVILYEMLAGHPPFLGGSPDAISYAIRHDAPVPLRSLRPDVPEEVEHVVFRALMKDPRLRYATGRELSRALRQARGQTVPLDLLTLPVAVPNLPRGPLPMAAISHVPRRRSRAAWAFAGLLATATVGGAWWAMQRAPRVAVLIAPVANQTGEPALDAYRLALTHAMVRALSESSTVRPVPYEKMLQALRRFQQGNADIGGRDALDALTVAGGTQTVVMPALVYDDRDRTWRGRIEMRDAATATATAAYETARVTSALSKDTAHGLVQQMALLVNEHLGSGGLSAWLSRAWVPSRLASIEAEKAFESGVSWYEEQEYASALEAFEAAAQLDRQSPLLHAWASRTALVMRRDDEARDTAERASALLSDRTDPIDRLFVEAVVAEARLETETAEARLRELVDRDPEEVRWRLDLAAFHDRRADSRDGWTVAVNDYHDVLRRDSVLLRPRLELCRLYNRLQEPAKAKQQGLQALSGYQAAGWRGGEALARFCVADVLRAGTSPERGDAQRHAEVALEILQGAGFRYNTPRALYYVGLSAASQGRFHDATTLWDRAAVAAEEGRNFVLQPLLMANLGVAQSRLGNVKIAADSYRRSAEFYERLGDHRRAAQQQANSGMLGIVFGLDVPRSARDVQNARAVFQQIGDADWEAASLEALGAYHRNAARYEDAERELARGLALAKERDLQSKITSLSFAQARVSFDREDYAAARNRLLALVADPNRATAAAWTLLARVHVRLGDFDVADANLTEAEAELQRREDAGLRPQVDIARGEVAYERGRFSEARQHWGRAARWPNALDEAVVWARTCLALLDGLQGRPGSGRRVVLAGIAQAHTMGRVSLEIAGRLVSARMALLEGRSLEATQILDAVAVPDEAQLGLELRTMLHYSRAMASGAAGRGREIETARQLLGQLRDSVPASYRERFLARRDLRRVLAGADSNAQGPTL
jgi:tetratricopeptide (TPR) repeat protein